MLHLMIDMLDVLVRWWPVYRQLRHLLLPEDLLATVHNTRPPVLARNVCWILSGPSDP
jgi:hypothetical protein